MKCEEEKFTYEQITKWRTVPVTSVVRAANVCHKGSDYRRSLKSDIYESFEKRRFNGSTYADRKMFVKIMDALEVVHYKAHERLYSEVGRTIREITGG